MSSNFGAHRSDAPHITPREAALRRITNHLLAARSPSATSDVVAWMGAMQGQDYRASTLSVAIRAGTPTDLVQDAYANRTIVRTWPMRGTLHVVPAVDAAWMVRLLAGRPISSARARYAQLGLTSETLARAMRLFQDVLGSGVALTRPQLYEAMEADGLNPGGQRGIHLIGHAAQTGLIVGTGLIGKQPAFALLESWAPRQVHLSDEEAMAELAWRYIRSHGPVTIRDFAWWTGSTMKSANSAFATHETKIEHFVVNDCAYVVARTDRPIVDDSKGVFLLPGFDELFLGYQDRTAMLEKLHHHLIVPGGNGVFQPVVISDGEVVGTWKSAKRLGEPPETRLFSHAPDVSGADLKETKSKIANLQSGTIM